MQLAKNQLPDASLNFKTEKLLYFVNTENNDKNPLSWGNVSAKVTLFHRPSAQTESRSEQTSRMILDEPREQLSW